MDRMTSPPETAAGRKPGLRLGLFVPFGLLVLVAALWTGGWFWARAKAAQETDAWIAREAAAGRTWTCADRAIGGYPFRLELRCAALRFARSDVAFSVGPVVAVAQVYQPRHVILEATGPFHVEQDGRIGDATWTGLEGSLHLTGDGFQRASLVVDGLKGQVSGAVPRPVAFTADHLELHARPTPGRFEGDGAIDLSTRVARAGVPLLDPILGGSEPADIALDATVTRATGFRTRPLPVEMEAWRAAGGEVELTKLSLAKGDRRVQAEGTVALDPEHRPAGRFEVRTAGLEGVIAPLIGAQLGSRLGGNGAALVGNLVGQFLGGGRRQEPEAPARPGTDEGRLRPLPTVRLADGRVMVGPFAIPNVRLDPLY
ncbi:DUF2125 domain-containing protein [Methylobacterium oryzihabitans]|uniref:DUF2125 domain-containing protein n=2 Tax=Methylobacterium oryzihabitans TaxID=2499852 RepID=A0A3S2YWM4_9HYPH|nr:DUF2125 domain-containing protein [Methylobacterium oryzihabitans]